MPKTPNESSEAARINEGSRSIGVDGDGAPFYRWRRPFRRYDRVMSERARSGSCLSLMGSLPGGVGGLRMVLSLLPFGNKRSWLLRRHSSVPLSVSLADPFRA